MTIGAWRWLQTDDTIDEHPRLPALKPVKSRVVIAICAICSSNHGHRSQSHSNPHESDGITMTPAMKFDVGTEHGKSRRFSCYRRQTLVTILSNIDINPNTDHSPHYCCSHLSSSWALSFLLSLSVVIIMIYNVHSCLTIIMIIILSMFLTYIICWK